MNAKKIMTVLTAATIAAALGGCSAVSGTPQNLEKASPDPDGNGKAMVKGPVAKDPVPIPPIKS